MPDLYLHHPHEIPIHIIPRNLEPHRQQTPDQDLCRGGLRCCSIKSFAPNTPVNLEVDLKEADITATGLILWCQKEEDRYILSIGFTDPQTMFTVRMIEQACEIECYRRRQARLGRYLSAEQAAAEWIELHAADFPHLGRLQ